NGQFRSVLRCQITRRPRRSRRASASAASIARMRLARPPTGSIEIMWARSRPFDRTLDVRMPATIAFLVPVTSRGRDVARPGDTEFLRVLVPSIVRTATWTSHFRYRVYLGYDAGDPFY